jgi:hypothetical protein
VFIEIINFGNWYNDQSAMKVIYLAISAASKNGQYRLEIEKQHPIGL